MASVSDPDPDPEPDPDPDSSESGSETLILICFLFLFFGSSAEIANSLMLGSLKEFRLHQLRLHNTVG